MEEKKQRTYLSEQRTELTEPLKQQEGAAIETETKHFENASSATEIMTEEKENMDTQKEEMADTTTDQGAADIIPQPQKNRPAKGRKKVIIPIIIVLGLLVVTLCTFVCVNIAQKKQGERIIYAIESGDINYALAAYQLSDTNVTERFKKEIKKAFTDYVFQHKFRFGTLSTGLIKKDQFEEYELYSRFCEAANYSIKEDAVAKYIHFAVSMKEDVKYNAILYVMDQISDDYKSFEYSFDAAVEAAENNEPSECLYYRYVAYGYIESVMKIVKDYTGYLCTDLKAAIQDIYLWIGSDNSYVTAEDVKSARNEVSYIKQLTDLVSITIEGNQEIMQTILNDSHSSE